MDLRRCARVAAGFALVVVLALAPRLAEACEAAAQGWADRCSAAEDVTVDAELCLPDRLLVRARAPGGAALRVEIVRGAGRGFVTAGDLSASPIGEFTNWSTEAAPARRALAAVVACAARGVPAAAFAPSLPPPSRTPWALLAAILALSVTVLARARPSRRALAACAGLAALSGVTWLARRAMLPASFFHPNGQGPLWVSYALGAPSTYGPGFRELFSHVVDGAAAPEGALFAAQSAAAALVPALAWVTARASGGSRLVASALAVALALDPVAGRAARSEAYYATEGTLLFASAASLALATRSLRLRSGALVAGSVASALFAAAALRVHPIGWVAAAMIPFGALGGRGRPRRRLRVGLAAGAIFTAALAVAGGPSVVEVLRGPLARQHDVAIGRMLGLAALGGTAAIAVVAASARRSATLARALILAAVAAAAMTTNYLGPATPWVFRAYLLLFAPAVVGLLAAALTPPRADRRRRTMLAAAALVLALLADLIPARRLTTRTTDDDEGAFAMRWREALPRGAVVHYVSTAGSRCVFLPLYPRYDGADATVRLHRLIAGEPVDSLRAGDLPVFYYASSLCATPEGRPTCEGVLRRFPLREVAHAELSPIESMPGFGHDADPVRVALYRLEGGR